MTGLAGLNSSPPTSLRHKLLSRKTALWNERASWLSHWQEIASYLLPRNGRFFSQDRNRGERKHNNIIDDTGTRALTVMAAGMMAGATSPARPWFRLATADPELNKWHPVKLWLDDCTKRMQMVFSRSNTYRALHQVYEELGAFGTAAVIVLDDDEEVIHHYGLTCGEYALAADSKGRVNALYREFDMTVGQLVGEFGIDQVSDMARNAFRSGNLDQWVTVCHAIEPRADRDPTKADKANMPWASYYFETGSRHDQMLREGGFEKFPVLAPRWATAGGDIYGNSPGMRSLGAVKQLQHQQLRKAQAIDYQTKPPLQAPNSLKNRDVESLPGGVTFVDAANPNAGIRPAWEVNLRLDYLLQDMQDVRERVNSAFFADLFLMLANNTDARMTATEVAERHEEKLLMLGPVLERLHDELLKPLIDITFERMLQAGMVPPPPPELLGAEVTPEFVSMLAQAQRAIGTNSIDRFVGNLSAVAAAKPEVLDKFDADAWADTYAEMLGVDPSLLVPTDRVQELRQARAQAMAAKEQSAMLEQQAGMAQKLASAQTNTPSVMTDLMGQLTGYSSPSPGVV